MGEHSLVWSIVCQFGRFSRFLMTVRSSGGSETVNDKPRGAGAAQRTVHAADCACGAGAVPVHVPVRRALSRGVGWKHDCHAAHMTAQPALSATGPAISAGGGPQACICCMSVATLSVSSGDSSYARRMSPTSASCLR